MSRNLMSITDPHRTPRATASRTDVLGAMRATAENIIRSGAAHGIEKFQGDCLFSLDRQADRLLSLGHSPRIAVLTGFPVLLKNGTAAFENDGPLGSGMLAAAFAAFGWSVEIVSDEGARPAITAVSDVIWRTLGRKVGTSFINYPQAPDAVQSMKQRLIARKIDHLISIERQGIANDGHLYNMLGMDISGYVAKADSLVEDVPWSTAAYSDGGNEIGFGNVSREEVSRKIAQGNLIASTTKVDYLTLCGVSNWGAYGLLCYLACFALELRPIIYDLLHPDFDMALFEAIRQRGAVDGITKRPTETIDSLPLSVHYEKIWDFRRMIDQFADQQHA